MPAQKKYLSSASDNVTQLQNPNNMVRSKNITIMYTPQGCSSHDQLLDKFGKDSLPEITGSLTPATLTGVLAWVSWLSENNIVSNSDKLVGTDVFII